MMKCFPLFWINGCGVRGFRSKYAQMQVFYSSHTISKSNDPQDNKLLKYLYDKIKATGPITVAEYMREVLTNANTGYYMHKDVFGAEGDFVTSPEISQMFGELISVWFYNEWSKVGQPYPVQLVEFGPGRGTLSDDILRVFKKLKVDEKSLSLHLIEVSPHLRKMQQQKLCCSTTTQKSHLPTDTHESVTEQGYSVSWHSCLETVPNAFSLFLAHEFFDALPIHKFTNTAEGWREVLIGYNNMDIGLNLQYVLSRNPTPASKLLIEANETRKDVEISPESGILIQKLAQRLSAFGGISLIIDYGFDNSEKSDTFRAFHKHKLHDPLKDPGLADLTADVDFSYLKKRLPDLAVSVGPVSQRDFLLRMEIDVRLQKLLLSASDEEKKSLNSGYQMLLDPLQMGERFKVFALFPAVLKGYLLKYPPAGFS